MTGPVLVTGATGKTGRRLLTLLDAHDVPTVAASRRAAPGRVRFDWTHRNTWDGALEGVRSAYLVAPMAADDPVQLMVDFIETAIVRGVERFVLLSASLLEAGGPAMGQVHRWLAGSGTEWAVLRPTWFMENLSEGPHCATIRDERAIYTAAGKGRVPFISAADIARAAAATLTAHEPPNSDFVLTGPELLDYDSVARRLTAVIGETVTHHPLSFDDLVAHHRVNGLGEAHAQTLAFMDLAIAGGAEDRTAPGLAELVSGSPVTFDRFAADNARLWNPV